MACHCFVAELACFNETAESNENAVLEGIWKIISAASMLSTTIYCFSPSGATFKWLRPSPGMAACEMGEEESIYMQGRRRGIKSGPVVQ